MQVLKLEKKSKGVYKLVIGEELKGIEITISQYGSGKWELSVIDFSKEESEMMLLHDFDNSKRNLLKILANYYNENKYLFIK